MELLVEETDIETFAGLMQRDWDETLRREGATPAPLEDVERCPACGSPAPLAERACPDCGLQLD
jgi:hypothetical protein